MSSNWIFSRVDKREIIIQYECLMGAQSQGHSQCKIPHLNIYIASTHSTQSWQSTCSWMLLRGSRIKNLNLLLYCLLLLCNFPLAYVWNNSSSLACKQLKVGLPPCFFFFICMYSRQNEQCTQTKPIPQSCAWVWFEPVGMKETGKWVDILKNNLCI